MKKSFLYAILLGCVVIFAVVKPPMLLEHECEAPTIKDTLDSSYIQKNIQELTDYIKAQKAALAKAWGITNGTFLTIFSKISNKGSVTTEEAEMLKNFNECDCASIASEIDWSSVQKKAESFIEKNSDLIKNKNKLHDALYEYLSEHNAIILGYQQKDRKSVVCAMYKDQANSEVKKAFLFGIAVTIEVEKQVEKKRG